MVTSIGIRTVWILISLLQLTQALHFSSPLYLGFDYGTSGVRTCLIQQDKSILHENSILWKDISKSDESSGRNPSYWIEALYECMQAIPFTHRSQISRICISGTSSTALLYNQVSQSISRQPCMYDYNVLQGEYSQYGQQAMETISRHCPPGSATNAPTSTLAKLLMWHFHTPLLNSEVLLHQADYIVKELVHKKFDNTEVFCSDWNNALKLGYDVYNLEYPKWLHTCLQDAAFPRRLEDVLPEVVEPGRPIGRISEAFIQLGYSPACLVVGGTTDSIAAFLASGASEPGQAVTSLGSTL